MAVVLGLSLLLAAQPCASCHPAEAAAWSRSPHAHSRSNRLFAASFARSRLAWCLDCHAPRVEAGGRRDDGVGCAACHQRGMAIATARPATAAGLKAHALVHDPSLASAEACARCHQFDAPAEMREPLRFTTLPMQDTVHEWRQSTNGRVQCQACHMAGGSHDIEGGHDVELLRRTVSTEFAAADGGWTAVLRVRGAGHGVPTGDPFRRFVFEVRGLDGGPALARRDFSRALWAEPDGGWVVRDTRAAPQFFAAPPEGFAWSLSYRMDEPGLPLELPAVEYTRDVAGGTVQTPR